MCFQAATVTACLAPAPVQPDRAYKHTSGNVTCVLIADCITVEGKLPVLDADGKPALMLIFASADRTRRQLQAQLVSLDSDGTVFAEFSRSPKEGALLMTDFAAVVCRSASNLGPPSSKQD